jgi:hypothetical protein
MSSSKQVPTLRLITSTKSSPGLIWSMSMKTLIFAKVRRQSVVKAASVGSGAFTAIVDEYLSVHVSQRNAKCALFYSGSKRGVELN